MGTELTSFSNEASHDSLNLADLDNIISLLDLTALKALDEDKCQTLGQLAQSYPVASLCIPNQFVSRFKKLLIGADVRMSIVVNFPSGRASLADTTDEINKSIADGVSEIDLVSPYHLLLNGNENAFGTFISACKAICGHRVRLKVILETGVLADLELIKKASLLAIMNGADFIKTSTGFVDVGASEEAVETMLGVIRAEGRCGIKISGGINHVKQAVQYLKIIDTMMGCQWASIDTVRFGSSQLLDDIIKIRCNFL